MGGGQSVVGLAELGSFQKDWAVAWRLAELRGNLWVEQKFGAAA
jgi:hypothetical protein